MKKNSQYAKTYRRLKPKPDYEAISGTIRIATEAVIAAVELHRVLSTPVPKYASGGNDPQQHQTITFKTGETGYKTVQNSGSIII